MTEQQLLSARRALEELCRSQPFDPLKKRTERIIQGAVALPLAALAAWSTYAGFELPPQEYNVLSLEGFKWLGNFLQGTWDSILAGATASGLFVLGTWKLVEAASSYMPVSFRNLQDGQIYFKDGGFMLDPGFLHRFFSRNVRPVDSASELEGMLEGKKSAGLILLNGVLITDSKISYAKINTAFGDRPISVHTDYQLDRSVLDRTNLRDALRGRTPSTKFSVLGELHKEDKWGSLTKSSDGTRALDLKYITPAFIRKESA